MLNDFQTNLVWENMLAAETRSLYFADLASRYTRQKQWISGISFFLSTGAAATLIGKLSSYVALVMALVVAVLNAYSMAVSLDRSVRNMVKLHCEWNNIASEYQRLWSHTFEEDAESKLEGIIELEKEPSELAATDAPNDQKLLGEWQQQVFTLYHVNRPA